jgi:hypothetical protein
MKSAVTEPAAFIVTAQVPVPLHPPPLQPVKLDPLDADAVKVTLVLASKLAEQVAPQLIPAGLLVTVPVPLPALVTLRVCGDSSVARLKNAAGLDWLL